MLRPCFVEINLNTILENYFNIKRFSKKEIIAVVKANAYGHGAIEVARALVEEGVQILAVATTEEALELRENFSDVEILILGPVPIYQKRECIKKNISLIISSNEEAKSISDISSELGIKAKVHIAIDTGMSRVGYHLHKFNDENIKDIVKIKDYKNIDFEGIFTHYAKADEEDLTFTYNQYETFKMITEYLTSNGFNFKYIHASNSAGSTIDIDDICNYARAGIALYGYRPSVYTTKELNIRPALSWKCKISHIKVVESGTPIGYGSSAITNKKSKIATIPVGYADGLRRELSNKYNTYYNGVKAPVIGKVCMDQTMIDVTNLNCSVGDEIDLISTLSNADDMANSCNTISYEILCGISYRVPRIYKKTSKKSNIR